jgi:L-asparaginase
MALADGLEVAVEDVSLTPSWALAPRDMQRIALRVREVARSGEFDGVVVTHGTQTLEYTAFLTDLFLDSNVPVVFTGAMRLASSPDSDGPNNLREALNTAASEEYAGMGVIVSFAGRTISARSAWKWSRSESDAFRSADSARSRRRRTFSGEIEPRVGMLKVHPGAGSEALTALVDSDLRGLVIEGLPGQGGVPQPMHQTLRAAAARMPVVLSSRAPSGFLSSSPTGGTGEPLRGLGLISARGLSSEKAFVLLMVALAEVTKREDVNAIFDEVGGGVE